MKSSLAVPLAGAAGLITILRATFHYYGTDAVACFITLMMAVALVLGIAELAVLSTRTRKLRAELLSLPQNATSDHVSRASPLLRALLSARLDRTNLPVPAPVFAPFLIGLLVMLGLLGTFLGLFETLRGTGQALTASADIDALRAGLKAPISGLMRGFGTSAAGVASSALLGLAAVFVRRDNARLSLNLHAIVSGPLGRFSSAHRELIALESLAEQGQAWPKAAQALSEAVAALKALEGSFVRSQRDASEQSHAQLQRATDGLSGLANDWRRAHAQAATQMQEAIASATAHVGEAMRDGFGKAAQLSSDALRPLVERAVLETSSALSAHLCQVQGAIAQDLDARNAELRAQLQALTGQLAERAQRLLAGEQARTEGLGERWQALAAATEQASARAAEREQSRAGALAELAQEVRDDLTKAAAALRARETRGSQAEERQQVRADALISQLGAAATTIGAAAADQVDALQQFVAATDGRLRESEARSEARLQALLQALSQRAEEQAQRLARFEQSLLERNEASAESLRDRLAGHADKLDQDLERTAGLVAQAATLLHGSGIELGATVESFAGAVEQQREGARAWLESLGELERAVANAGEAAAADVLGQHLVRTHELFDQQLQFHQELIEQLRSARRDSIVAPRIDAAE
jgi:hypothetical protein